MTELERLFRRLVDNLIAIDPARLHRPLAVGELLSSVIPYRTNRRALQIDTVEDFEMLVLRLAAGEGGFVHAVSDDVGQVFRDQLEAPNPDLGVLQEYAMAELVIGTEPLAHALGPGPDEAFAPPDEEFDFPGIERTTTEMPAGPRAPAPPDPDDAPIALPITRPPRGTSTGPRRTVEPAESEPKVRPLFTAEPTPPDPPMMPPPPRMTAEPEPRRRRDDVRCSYCGGPLPAGRTVNFCPHCGQNQALTRCPECQAEMEIGWRHCINCGHAVGEE